MLKTKSMDKTSPKECLKGENSGSESAGDETASISTTTTSRSKSPGSRRQRRSRSVHSKTKVNRPSYKYDCHLKEDHGQAIFGVAFNYLLGKEQPLVFATAGSNRCSVYECPTAGGLKLLLVYADPDPDEVFYTCCWSYDAKTSVPLLATAGYRGVVRVIDVQRNQSVGNYIGHGQAINELKFHPRAPYLLLSGSKDHAIRLWNIQTHVCIAIFGGVEGHRDEVLSIDFDLRGERIMSSGMDHSLKLWRLNTSEFQDKIDLSRTFNVNKSQMPFPTIMQHFPDFSTRDIHRNYVDCVQWFGDFVLSKSCENSIVCWKPGQLHQNLSQLKPNDASCTIICEFNYDECEMWFVRFGFNPWHKMIALGNQYGKVYVWELDPTDPRHTHASTLNNLRCTSIVRQTTFSRDASVLVWVCDDATVWRWNRKLSEVSTPRLADEDDELSEVQPDAVPPEVREWLASTFTRQLATTRRKNDEKPKFRSVAHAIRAGIFVDRIYRRVSSSALMQFPPEVMKVLKTLDDWCFDVFALAESANGQPVKYLGYDLLNRYGIIHKFKIAPATLETFLNRIEEGYCRYRNPYHNNLHAADVTQTVHHMLCQTGLMNWLTDLEIYATLLAALIHDYEHTGTTNNFHVMSGSETALLYNDRAVLENHHVSAAFRLLKDDDCNILSNLSREEYRELRTLVIDMVLSTDMSFHFQQLKNMRSLLTLNEATVDKSKALALVLHCCDISHPAKRWNIHHRWTMLLLEEFFRQGDLERELGLPFSPLCDRNNTLVAESQIGFIDFIVEPSMSVMADMLEHALAHIAPMCKNVNASIDVGDETIASGVTKTSTLSAVNRGTCSAIQEDNENKSNEDQIANGKDKSSAASDTPLGSTLSKQKFTIHKPWILCLTENKKIWKEQAIKDAEARVTVTTSVPAQADQITETAKAEAN